ncbi:phosphate uptake regulator PhoU [Candidatus Woesearchaeota archaeon]|nr:phosphate uptake regulator PhoU [Candidatus Woesearchaeota archaeon]
MHARKLVKAGPSSHTVSLPKEWLTKNQLTKGSTVYILEHGADLRITADVKDAPTAAREKTIEIDNKDIETIGREITSAYINNYSSIVLAGSLTTDKVKDIRRVLRDFPGLEIVEQTAKRLVANDLLNIKEVSIDKTLRRMDMTVRSMMQDSITASKEAYDAIVLRDYDMNRMYFLLYRLLKGSLKDPRMAQHLQLSNDAVLTHWLLANNLENLADAIKNACRALQRLSPAEAKEAKENYAAIEALYLDAMKSQFTNDRALADSVAQRRHDVIGNASKLASKHHTPTMTELREQFETMATLITNVARGVIDRE